MLAGYWRIKLLTYFCSIITNVEEKFHHDKSKFNGMFLMPMHVFAIWMQQQLWLAEEHKKYNLLSILW